MIMQNSTNLQDLDQDPRQNDSMENSTTMTIEFLRARLLSERSVSSTARRRADELAKRVVELEEQLKTVSLQRKKAEKTIAYAHAILENHGISGFSDEFDSCSDHEVIHYVSKVGKKSPEEEEEEGSSVGSKMRRNYTDEFSGSEPESSPLPHRSLSRKGGKDSSRSREKKYMDSSTRRRSTFASTASASPRCRDGKSCPQIRKRETRSAVEESQNDNSMLTPHDNGVASCSEGFPTHSDIGPEILRKSSEKQDAKINLEGSVSRDLENPKLVANATNYLKEYGSDKNMERALEHQAQLIGQYEEEEKAQREWEEKFRENNNSTPSQYVTCLNQDKLLRVYKQLHLRPMVTEPPSWHHIPKQDSCEPGNHSDITEERDETKAHAPPYPVGTLASQDQEAKLKVEEVCYTKESSQSHSDGFQSSPRVDKGRFQCQKSSSMLAHESPASDFVFPMAMGKQDQQHSRNYSVPPSHSYHHCSCSESPTGDQSARIVPSHTDTNFCKGETSVSKNEQYALVPRETPDKLDSVLGTLHQAKLSLKHKLKALPPIDGGPAGKAIQFSVADKPEVPIGYAGIFRVPSDFSIEATTKANIPASNPQLSLTKYYPDTRSALAPVDHFVTSPSTESRPSISTDDRHLVIPTSLYMESRSKTPTWEPQETWSRFPSRQPFFAPPSLDTGLPPSNRYIHGPNMDTGLAASNTYPTRNYPFYHDPMPQMPSNEGPRLFSGSGAGNSPANHFSFHNNHGRSNMYR